MLVDRQVVIIQDLERLRELAQGLPQSAELPEVLVTPNAPVPDSGFRASRQRCRWCKPAPCGADRDRPLLSPTSREDRARTGRRVAASFSGANMPRVSYTAPATVDEAVKALAGAAGQARILSGGTDLLFQLKAGG